MSEDCCSCHINPPCAYCESRCGVTCYVCLQEFLITNEYFEDDAEYKCFDCIKKERGGLEHE